MKDFLFALTEKSFGEFHHQSKQIIPGNGGLSQLSSLFRNPNYYKTA